MSKAKGDKIVLGNSMQSLATLLGKRESAGDGEVRQLFSNQALLDQLPDNFLSPDPILEEALAAVRAMTPEQLKEIGNRIGDELVTITEELLEEPDHHGDTSHGLNPIWIDWYCKANSCRVWKAIAEGKRRLRAAKETPKRKKRVPNPK